MDHRQVLLLVGLETLGDGLSVVVGAALATSHEALDASLLVAVKEEHVLGLADVSLEVGALVDLPGESVDQIVLISNVGFRRQ